MDKEKLANAIVRAIGYVENGGKPDVNKLKPGASGEMKSVFQFTPATWKLYSKQVMGKEVPLSPDAETFVVHKKVKDWLDNGYNPEQIASMWNAGERRPDAYKENWKGVNKYGVAFDTPGYVKKFKNHLDQFSNESTEDEITPSQPSQVANQPSNQGLIKPTQMSQNQPEKQGIPPIIKGLL